MSQRRRPSRRKGPPAPAAVSTPAPTAPVPADPRRVWRRLSWMGAGLALVIGAILVGCYAKRRPEPAEPKTASQQIVEEFQRLHNAGDPKAGHLLGPAPAVP